MNARLRAAVFARSRGLCECGCGRPISAETDHLDHFFGRAKADESVENCWALSVHCDQQKTTNVPGGDWWLERYIRHLRQHYGKSPCGSVLAGAYLAAWRRAHNRLMFVRARTALVTKTLPEP